MLTFRELEYIKEELRELRALITTHGLSDKWLNLKEAIDYTGLSSSTLQRQIARGSLKASRKVGKILIKRSQLDKFLLS